MRASLELLESFGQPEVSAYVLDLAQRVREGAQHKGFAVYGGGKDTNRAITSLLEPAAGWGKIRGRMEQEGIRVSWRKEHSGKTLLRVSPHICNTVSEIETFLRLLGQ